MECLIFWLLIAMVIYLIGTMRDEPISQDKRAVRRLQRLGKRWEKAFEKAREASEADLPAHIEKLQRLLAEAESLDISPERMTAHLYLCSSMEFAISGLCAYREQCSDRLIKDKFKESILKYQAFMAELFDNPYTM